MTNEQEHRPAGLIAGLVAVPVALLAAFVVFQVMKPGVTTEATPSPSASAKPMATSPVTMAAPPLDERAATVCRALLSQLPEQIRNLPRRAVTAGHEQNAAFGDPPVTLSCGGPAPSFPPTDLVSVMDRVCWHPNADGTVWTTVDREVPVAVAVPAGFDSPGQWTNAFSRTVVATVPSAADIPSGCQAPR